MLNAVELKEILDDYEACERGEFNIYTLAFSVAKRMVDTNDAGILNLIPQKLQEEILNISRVYRRDGTVVSQSSVGRAFHDELGAALTTLLDSHLGANRY